MPFDVQGALSAGYAPAQIADEVGKAAGFDTAATSAPWPRRVRTP